MTPETVDAMEAAFRSALPDAPVPLVALVLGSGMSGIADCIDGEDLPFDALPGFASATVQSHAGHFRIGHLDGHPVIAQCGRLHLYEGHAPAQTVLGIRLMARLGAHTLLTTNAAGAVDPSIAAGSLAVIEDHISLPNFAGLDPLRGTADRFVSLNGAYDRNLLIAAEDAARNVGSSLHRAVYAQVVGPTFETPAEIRALHILGADIVGMSTVPEVITARALGLRVLALSAISNVCVDSVESDTVTTAEDAFATLQRTAPDMERLIRAVLPTLAREPRT